MLKDDSALEEYDGKHGAPKEVEAKLVDVLLEGDDLETRVGPARNQPGS